MESEFVKTITSSYNNVKDTSYLSLIVTYYIIRIIFPILIIGLIILYILYSPSILAKDIRGSF